MAHSGFKQLKSVQNSLSFVLPSSPWQGSKPPGCFCIVLALQVGPLADALGSEDVYYKALLCFDRLCAEGAGASGFCCHVLITAAAGSQVLASLLTSAYPVHQARALVSCLPPGLGICFTLDNIHVSMLFSRNITLAFSHRVQKSVLYICVSFSVLHIGLSLPSF